MNKNLRRYKFCRTVHVWGKSLCPKFNKELDKNSKSNFSSAIASAKNYADEKSSDGEKKTVKSRGCKGRCCCR